MHDAVANRSHRRGRRLVLASAALVVLLAAWAALRIIPGLVTEYRLISRLDSPSEDERDAATKRLVELGSVRAIPKLLYTGDAAFRICRARGAAAVPTILRIIDEGTHRVQAARLLAEIGPEAAQAAPRLIALLDDPQPKARAYAAEALCEINAGNEQALSKLRQWVVDPDAEVWWDAARVIHSLGEGARPFIPELVECLRRNAGSEGHDPWARWALCALGREAALAVAPLLDDPSEEVRLAAVDVIGSAGREAPSLIPLLVRFLRDSSPDARTKVIQELEYMGAAAREAAPALVDIVQAESRELAWKAMISLARIGEWSGQAIPAALERMDQERPTFPMDVLQDLLFALNDHGPPPAEVLPILLRVLREEEAWLRTRALEVLAHMAAATQDTLPLLEQASRDPDRWTRAWARCVLSRFRPELGPALIEEMLEALKVGDSSGKAHALEILALLGGDAARAAPLAIEAVLTDSFSTDTVISARKLITSAGDVAPIAQALEGSDQRRKRFALKLFVWGDPGPSACSLVSAIAGVLHAPPPVEGLAPDVLMEDDRLREFACQVLGNVGRACPEAIVPLKQALREPTQRIRAAARQALERIERAERP